MRFSTRGSARGHSEARRYWERRRQAVMLDHGRPHARECTGRRSHAVTSYHRRRRKFHQRPRAPAADHEAPAGVAPTVARPQAATQTQRRLRPPAGAGPCPLTGARGPCAQKNINLPLAFPPSRRGPAGLGGPFEAPRGTREGGLCALVDARRQRDLVEKYRNPARQLTGIQHATAAQARLRGLPLLARGLLCGS